MTNNKREDNSRYSKISDRDYFIPFGLFSKSKEAEVKASEVFVGREGERANLIQKLLTSGRHAAFLITGSRGTGKTSFVDYCLKEYKSAYSYRFMRSGIGKSIQDYVMLVITTLVFIAIPLFISHALNNSADNIENDSVKELNLLLALVLLWPAILSFKTWQVYGFIKRPEPALKNIFLWIINIPKNAVFIGIIGNVAIGVISYFVIKHNASDHLVQWILSSFIVFVSLLFFFKQLCLVYLPSLAKYKWLLHNYQVYVKIVFAVLFLGCFCFIYQIDIKSLSKQSYYILLLFSFALIAITPYKYGAHLLIGKFLFKATICLSFLYLYYLFLKNTNSFTQFWTDRHWWIFVFMPIFVGLSLYSPNPSVQFLKKSNRHLFLKNKVKICKNREKWLLFSKALFLEMFSIILLFNVVVANVDYRKYGISVELSLGSFEAFFLLACLLIVIFIAYLEYDWIIRPSRSITQESSLSQYELPDDLDIADDLPPKNAEETNDPQKTQYRRKKIKLRDRYRKLSEQTFSHALFEFWLPVITVKINLGFDVIDHRTVIGAMLTGIRREYKKSFISWKSYRILSYTVVYCSVFIWLVFNVSVALFDIPHHKQSTDQHSLGEKILREVNLDAALPLLYQNIWSLNRTSGNSTLQYFWGGNRSTVACEPEWVEDKTKKGPYDCYMAFDLTEEFITIAKETLTEEAKNKHQKVKDALAKAVEISANSSNDKTPKITNKELTLNEIKTEIYTLEATINENKNVATENEVLKKAINEVLLKVAKANAVLAQKERFTAAIEKLKSAITIFDNTVKKVDGIKGDSLQTILDENAKAKDTLTKAREKIGAEIAQIITNKNMGYYHLYIYHLLVALVLYLILKRIFRQLPLLPFRNNLRAIDQLLSDLSQTVQAKEKQEVWKFANLFRPIMPGGEKEHTTTSQPSDSRTIELKFLSLLENLQQRQMNIFGLHFSLPHPEITFVFDELDKLSEKSGSVERENIPRFRDSVNVNISKRHIHIQKMMSDMKNIISSGEARFIFIGGRELQDSWLADQTDRNPLLTSIFDAVIYLPSLLANTNTKNRRKITDFIYSYFHLQYKRANKMMDAMNQAFERSSILNHQYDHKETGYTQETYSIQTIKERLFFQNGVHLVYLIAPDSQWSVADNASESLVNTFLGNNRLLNTSYCQSLFQVIRRKSKNKVRYELKKIAIEPESHDIILSITARLTLVATNQKHIALLKEKDVDVDVGILLRFISLLKNIVNKQDSKPEQINKLIKKKTKKLGQSSPMIRDTNLDIGGFQQNSDNDVSNDDQMTIYRMSAFKKLDGTKELDGLKIDKVDDHYKQHFLANFIDFLAYRSQGNPKKLEELFSSLVVPSGRVFSQELLTDKSPNDEKPVEDINNESSNDEKPVENINNESPEELAVRENCQNVLYLSDVNMVRIQILSQLFERLEHYFHQSLAGRDDKIVSSIFYLSDFLFKFHKRAFAWDSLEKIDELSDINRAPDIRTILQQIVNACSPLFFHQVLNGMYVFRFRSEMTKEISYVSRFSPTEMAAFNFTLDESTPLKELYLNKLKDGKSGEPALIVSLGELYEYDEEFDSARKEYNRALLAIDNQLKDQMFGEQKNDSEDSNNNEDFYSTVFNILTGEDRITCRLYGSWAVFRLRIMLQIGMTYEQSKNLERAQMQYSDADNFAKRIIQSLVAKYSYAKDDLDDNALHVLKHFNLLYQPLFAKAWVAEKLEGSVDTSIDIVEKEVHFLRKVLPFSYDKENITPISTSNSNLLLVMSEVHNKTGDLCFFKGMSINAEPEEYDNQNNTKKSLYMGYIFQAHYHYALSLHEIKDFIYYRVKNAKYKFGVPCETDYFGDKAYPAFVCTTLASNLSDMAEATLARIDSCRLLFSSASIPTAGYTYTDYSQAYKKIEQLKGFISHFGDGKHLKPLWAGWYGISKYQRNERQTAKNSPNSTQLLEFNQFENNHFERFSAYLVFCEMSFNYLIQGGYTEDAINEYLKSVRTITRVLFWHKVDYFHNSSDLVVFLLEKVYIRLVTIIQKLTSINTYIHRVRRAKENTPIALSAQEVLMVRVVSSAILLSGQLKLTHASHVNSFTAHYTNLIKTFNLFLEKTILTYRFEQQPAFCSNAEIAETLLEELIKIYRYPILNRLESLNILLMNKISQYREEILPGEIKVTKQEKSDLRDCKTIMLAEQQRLEQKYDESGIDLLGEDVDPYVTEENDIENPEIKKKLKQFKSLEGIKSICEEDIEAYGLKIDLAKKFIKDKQAQPLIAPIERAKKIKSMFEELNERADELRDLQQKFDAPMHFPELHSGITFYALGKLLCASSTYSKNARYWLHKASDDLKLSQQSYTMRAKYYENISNLYYLYDDFNDRQRHYNHAIDMLGGNLTIDYIEKIREMIGNLDQSQ